MKEKLTVEDIAKICHEANRYLCESTGDFSQKQWIHCQNWQATSAINGVEYCIKNPNSTPEQIHENWVQDKLADGWTYGLIRDGLKKEHPCMVKYDELPIFQRAKDSLFQSIVKSLIPYLN